MEAVFWFWFVFGAAVGMAALPHLQRIAARVRHTLAELDQPKHVGCRNSFMQLVGGTRRADRRADPAGAHGADPR